MSLTGSQRAAIRATGNVLVVAGAGTGKTSTLVARCLDCIVTHGASLDELLLVTFTDAAAAEMRQRLRRELEQAQANARHSGHVKRQLALFETAHIGTLHSFCLKLAREHFYELALDPQFSVMPEEESRLLLDETLDRLLEAHYGGRGKDSEGIRRLIQVYGGGRDTLIRRLVLRLHHYSQTLPNAAEWLDAQLKFFADDQPRRWKPLLAEAVCEWRDRSVPLLESLVPDNKVAVECLKLVQALSAEPLESAAAFLQLVSASKSFCADGKKGAWLKPLASFLDEAAFLQTLMPKGGSDPLLEDWQWTRAAMGHLLGLARECGRAYATLKRESGVVDFHDLEQHALTLLWDAGTGKPSEVAREWRRRLRFVFVDEYQDINAAQDKIIEGLSREGADGNRFLVGDVKQSIYRFRLAKPDIFVSYTQAWTGHTGQTIPLRDNFRSRDKVLLFVNSFFDLVMLQEFGGVDYAAGSGLIFGAREDRQELTAAADQEKRVELHLLVTSKTDEEPEGEEVDAARNLANSEKEARMVALRLREMVRGKHPIFGHNLKRSRPVEWRDIALLLRSPSTKAESYAKEFGRVGVPLHVARGGFYGTLEIGDLISALHLLDNPVQDIPLLAVLRSPLVGLTLEELAQIRLAVRKVPVWAALLAFHGARTSPGGQSESGDNALSAPPEAKHSDAAQKVQTFLERFGRWRRLARQASLSQCLEAILAETHYLEWLLTQNRGEQRRANVLRLLSLAQDFDHFQRQGLFRFLRFVESQSESNSDPGVAPSGQSEAVRLMSIHQSKGLEFPVVVVADLAKPFNCSDLNEAIILDEKLGLCPQVKPPQTQRKYPSLPNWLARRRQKREVVSEELRLLYVAMTRAKDTLILTGTVNPNWFKRGPESDRPVTKLVLEKSKCYADWIRAWFMQHTAIGEGQKSGEHPLITWTSNDHSGLVLDDESATNAVTKVRCEYPERDAEAWQMLRTRLQWRYKWSAATNEPAKTSVSELRRAAKLEFDEESVPLYPSGRPAFSKQEGPDRSTTGPMESGSAHHLFLQHVDLERVGSLQELKLEVGRLAAAGTLAQEQASVLDLDSILGFWKSELGRRIIENAQYVKRELAFTARFGAEEVAEMAGRTAGPELGAEFVIVQGAADLVVVRPEEIWLLDFKTDKLTERTVEHRARFYAPQLKLYGRALERIYRRNVTGCWLYFLSVRRAIPIFSEAPAET